MPAPAEIFEKTVGPPGPERVLILNTRSLCAYPFEATNWMDLRVGFFLSLTQASADDTPGGALAEPLNEPPHGLPFTDCYFVGIIDRATGGTFAGFTNANPARNVSHGNSLLVSSDSGIGIGTNFWRPKNSQGDQFSLSIIDGGNRVGAPSVDGSQIHFAQVPAGAGGYATLLALRFQRDNPTSKTITMTAKRDTTLHSGDILFSNDPSSANLKSNLETFPTTVQQLGPVEVTRVPDSLYLYWPFRLSRLRCHSLGLVKAR